MINLFNIKFYEFLSSNLQANQANIFDGNEPKNLFGETTSSETVIVPAAGLADLENAPGTSASTTSQKVCCFTPVDQRALQNKRIYQVRMNVRSSGKLDCRIINLNVTDRLLTISDIPSSITAFKEASSILFSATIPSSDTGIQNIKLDGTDERVTYINPEFVEDGYIKIPAGYYLSFTDDTTSTDRVVWYYGGSQPTGNSYHFLYYSSESNPTISATTSSSLSISVDIVEEQIITTTDYNFDNYLVTKEEKTVKEPELLADLIASDSYSAPAVHGIYFFNAWTQQQLNDNVLSGVSLYPREGKVVEFVKATVATNNPMPLTANTEIAAMRAGTTIPSQYVLFRINATDLSTSGPTYFALDGSDSRVEIVNTELYDEEKGGFPWSSTMALGVSDWLNPSSSSGNDSSTFFYKSSGVSGARGGFHSSTDSGTLTDGTNTTSSLFVNLYTTTETTEIVENVHSGVIDQALKDIEELKENNTESPLKDKYISFLGDSITTFEGWSNIAPGSTSAHVWYPHGSIQNVNQTYWKKLIDRTGAKLLVNNSWSGSRCANSGSGPVVSTSNDRCKQLHKDGHNPDYIVINIGTNDFDNGVLIGSWNGRGERFIDNPDTTAPTTFREAYSVMLGRLRKNYPLAKIYCCTIPCGNVRGDGPNEINSEGVSLVEYNDAIREVATAHGCRVAELATSGLDYYTLSTLYEDNNLHPNEAGMERYYEVIRYALESEDTSNVSTPRLSKLMTGTATAISDSTASDVSGLVTDFNALLAVLRVRGVISAS